MAHPINYVMVSVHCIGNWVIDLTDFKDEYDKRDIKEVYTQYYDQIVTLAESMLFAFVGHIDLIKIFSYRPDDQAFIDAQYDRVVEALVNSDTCIEISSAVLRKPVGEIYSDPRFIQNCYDEGVGIVFCSVAHMPR